MPTYKKYFQNKFLLNGVELENVSIGASAIGKFEEPLDEAGLHLPFTIRDYEYPMRGLLQIFSEDYAGNKIENAYLILSDEVEEGSKYGEWKHNLIVMEYSGKYDAYLYHTFTYTKPLKDNNPAPFEIKDTTLITKVTGGIGDGGYNFSVFLKPLNIVTTYFSNEDITIKQVEQALQATDVVATYACRYESRDAWVMIDDNVLTKHTISSSDYTFQLEEGSHYIDYGFNAVESDMVPTGGDKILYRFHFNVIPRSNFSLLDAINIIRDSKPFESKLYHANTRLFNIDPAIESYLASIEMPQMFLQKATMRQILNTIFSYVNAISRFTYNEGNLDTLSMDEYNKIVGDFNLQDVVAFNSNQEATRLFNQGVVWGERVLPSSFEEETITSPAENLYKTVRSTQVQITDTKFGIPLEAELYQPKELKVMLDFISIQPFGFDEAITNNYVLDLTPRFINREEWYLKLFTVNFPTPSVYDAFENGVGLRENRVSNLYWQQGSKEINLSEVVGESLQTNIVFSTIEEGFNEYLTREYARVITPKIYYDSIFEENLLTTLYYVDYKPSTSYIGTNDYIDLKFQIKYITFESFPFQTHRENISNSIYYSEGRLNQNDKAMNIAFASMRAHGDTQRSGVPNFKFTKIYEDYSDILRWGMKDSQDYVIVEEKFEYHNEFVKATYTATQDHNRLSLWTKVDQEYRWQEIPQSNQVFERQEIFNENIVISNPNTTLATQTTMINNGALDLIFGTLMNDWKDSITDGKTKVTLGYVRTDGFIKVYPNDSNYKYLILTPVRSFGGKHGFSFVFGFEGNQVAGNQVEIVDVSGADTYWNKEVRYTDTNGEFTTLWFAFATKFLISPFHIDGYSEEQRLQNYPLTRLFNQDDFWVDSFVTHKSGEMDFDGVGYNGLMFGRKDKSQSIKVAIQNSVFPLDYKEYVIGLSFFTNNFIVNNPETMFDNVVGTPMYFYPYGNGTKYDKFSIYKVKSGYGTPKLLQNGSNVSFSSGQFRFSGNISMTALTSWAIGDALGNLYLACNFPYNGFNVSRQHFYPNQSVIGDYIPDVKFASLDTEFDLSANFTYVRGREVPLSIDNTFSFLSNILYYVGDSVPQTIDFGFDLSYEMQYYRSKDIGQTMNFGYTFDGDFTFEIQSGIVMDTQFDLGFDLVFGKRINQTMMVPYEIDMTWAFAKNVPRTLNYQNTLSYDIQFSTDTVLEMALPMNTSFAMTFIKNINQTLDNGFDLSYNLTYGRSNEVFKTMNFGFATTYDITYTKAEFVPVQWSYIGTSKIQDFDVTYVGEGSTCATSSVIDAWLETNYPVSNYAVGDVVRVTRANEDLVICSPLYYFYEVV